MVDFGLVPASRTARFWRLWTSLFLIFPVDAATVHSNGAPYEAVPETRLARWGTTWIRLQDWSFFEGNIMEMTLKEILGPQKTYLM